MNEGATENDKVSEDALRLRVHNGEHGRRESISALCTNKEEVSLPIATPEPATQPKKQADKKSSQPEEKYKPAVEDERVTDSHAQALILVGGTV